MSGCMQRCCKVLGKAIHKRNILSLPEFKNKLFMEVT